MMVKFFYAIITVCLLLSFNSAFSQKQTKAEKQKIQREKIRRIVIDSQYYQFIPQFVLPSTGKSRYITGFSLKISKIKIESYLPYFGVAYQADYGSNKSPFDFTSTNFTYTVTNRKKGGWDILMEVKDTNDFKQLRLTIFEDGAALLQITSNNRQSISYNGNVQEIKEKKPANN